MPLFYGAGARTIAASQSLDRELIRQYSLSTIALSAGAIAPAPNRYWSIFSG
ncbi:hypothetical protein [Microcoleus sp. N3A4]|uniref:hypothetical protein n=1 Tax=Microcoleus sp. N3A4 TaxID=3055379 RepID=UPI002FD3503C